MRWLLLVAALVLAAEGWAPTVRDLLPTSRGSARLEQSARDAGSALDDASAVGDLLAPSNGELDQAVGFGGGGGGGGREKEFKLNLGRAIDVLRRTCPVFLDEEPEWDIYTEKLETRDPAGVALRGLGAFQAFHALLRSARALLVAPDGASINYRLTCGASLARPRSPPADERAPSPPRVRAQVRLGERAHPRAVVLAVAR